MIEVSVIMPAFNASKFISESIESVIAQTFPHWELIIVDDGSTDNTAGIIQTFARTEKRIKYVWQMNGKQGRARNNALKLALGRYIAFLDADDLWMPNKLEIQLGEIEEQNADLVFSDSYFFQSLPFNTEQKMNTVTGLMKGGNAIAKMLEMNRVPILTVLAKKDVIKKVNGFSEKKDIQNNEDYHLWLKLLLTGFCFYGSPQILSAYRHHPESVSYNNRLSTKQTIETLYDLMRTFPTHRQLLSNALKKWFNRHYDTDTKWDKTSWKEIIGKNCIYLGKSEYCRLMFFFYDVFGHRASKQLLVKFFNA